MDGIYVNLEGLSSLAKQEEWKLLSIVWNEQNNCKFNSAAQMIFLEH